MKVLFAVNSESISEAIIKKYQKDYREILSYKNVYYFNAIQKEIQQDKTYDRIVISEDLEPFSNNNYESIDKFIFEKLDGISDEAHDTQGNEISIILICSDRHTKGSSFLVKIFGIGVYNALLGNDRSMEEVCRLIHKPRTKKEAKMYYKIDTDDVNYRAENENEVSELEIQNIIAHFKKLGKSTEKYASSFENIANQYTDEQLKIIINCLPMNVKAVLEEHSTKYQDIMSVSGTMVKGVKSTNMATKEDQKRTGLKIDIIENKMNQTKMTKPIVIPNSVKTAKSDTARRVISVPTNPQNAENMTQTRRVVKRTNPEIEDEQLLTKRVEPKKKVVLGEDMENNRNNQRPVQRQNIDGDDRLVKREERENLRRAEPVKPIRKTTNAPENKETQMQASDAFDELEDIEIPDFDFDNNELATNSIPDNLSDADILEEVQEIQPVKRGRGRPRKNPVDTTPKPKGKRGRPRKNPISEPIQQQEMDLFAEEIEEPEPRNAIQSHPQIPTQTQQDNVLPDLEDDWADTEFDAFGELEDINEGIDEIQDDTLSDEVVLPELDELDSLEDFEDFDLEDEFEEENTLPELAEESFDEFEDYDEYGEYQTQTKQPSQEEKIDDLYQEDMLDLEDDIELPEFDELEEVEELSQPEMVEEVNQPENNLLSDFDDEEDLLSAVDFEDDEMDTLEMGTELEADDAIFDSEENLADDTSLYDTTDSFTEQTTYNPQDVSDYGNEALESIASPIDYSMSNLASLMTKDKKIVTFLGSPKNGVSFLVNNLAEIFASVGIDTAILDMTKNKNSYYIYTQNEESLRKIAYSSLEKLQQGVAEGIQVKQNLTVYTALPNDGKDYSNAEPILSSLVQSYSLVLIDCDFDTNPSYFASAQEIYLVQSMDILTIQPLTAFLRDLKTQGVLEPEKVRVVINKELKVRGLTNKAIIGGMSFYNDPAMSFMTELFNKDSVKYCSIPFEEMAYSKYLEAMLNCKVSINGYSKNFMNKLRNLGDMVYPLTSRQTYSPKTKQNYNQGGFSNSMNNTLNKMKKKF